MSRAILLFALLGTGTVFGYFLDALRRSR